MARMHDYDQIDALWTEWQTKIALRPTDPPEDVLAAILRAGGTALTAQEVSFALGGVDRTAMLDVTRFTDCMVALLGDPPLRLRHAFSAFQTDESESIAKSELLAVICAFDDDTEEAALLADEIDADGDGRINLQDLTHFLEVQPDGVSNGYRASHLPDHHVGAPADHAAVAMVAAATASENHPVHDEGAGLSSLQLRVGFFRLMQGAAYRSFRENYAANSETHLRARDLPYTIDNFARFTTALIDYYLSLGVVTDPGCVAEFRRLDEMVQDEVARLHNRIATWASVQKTPGMLAAQGAIKAERDGLSHRRELCRSVIEFILALRMHGLGLDQAGADMLAHHEINRLRHQELRAETHRSTAEASDADLPYIDTWNRVILSDADARVDGAIMPTRFWYDEFMPQLLLCASLGNADDLTRAKDMTEADLNSWHAKVTGERGLDHFATDLRDGFSSCSRDTKMALHQAWILTEPYLNGVEKSRERAEFGRGSGFLSEYVAFVDVPLGRHDIASADMRLSFPYYIGPAVWGLLHGSAELVEAKPDPERLDAIDRFVSFFRSFATMYPCPYCRYHLNRYVIRNREVEMYPVEFLLLGRDPDQNDTSITLDDKLATVSAPGGLRTFLWKLHNAVSSSIARTEPWYHRQEKPLYTSRFWPSIEAELARAAAFGHHEMAVDKLAELLRITKSVSHLAALRDELSRAIQVERTSAVAETIERAQEAIADLDETMNVTGYLSRKYAFDPELVDKSASTTETLDAFARSDLFVER